MILPVESWDEGRLRIHADFADLLRQNGLTTADALWALPGETVKKYLRERGTERAWLKTADGAPVEVYLKRFLPLPAREYVKGWLGGKPVFADGAIHEWEAILAFHAHGLATMVPLAAAALHDGRTCCLTLGLGTYVRASDLFPQLAVAGEVGRDRRLSLIRAIGRLVGRMHGAKFAHQDCYLVHLFIKEAEGDEVYLMDLQRTIFPKQFRRRWRVKDLGQLLYSTRDAFSRADLLRFWQTYAAAAGAELYRDRALLRAVFAKAAALRRRTERKSAQEKR
jgi:hypothetical protein